MDRIAYLDMMLNLKLYINNNKLQNMHDAGKSNVLQFQE
jgi:hypothetical protein